MIIDWNPRNIEKDTNDTILKSHDTMLSGINTEYLKYLKNFADDVTRMDNLVNRLIFIVNVIPDKNIKETANSCLNKLYEHQNEIDNDVEIYKNLNNIYQNNKMKMKIADLEFITKILRSYRKKGIELDSTSTHNLNSIKSSIKTHEHDISKTILEYNRHIAINLSDLEGMPLSIIKQLPIIDSKSSKYGIKLTPDMFNLCVSFLKSETMRKRITHFYYTRCSNNIPKLAELFYLRSKLAKAYGCTSYTDYILSTQSIKKSKNIKKLISSLLESTKKRYIREVSCLSKLSRRDGLINFSDYKYLISKWKARYGVNDDYIRTFFPYEFTIRKILEVFENVFEICIEEIDDKLWDESVKLYKVYDSDTEGYFYMDIFKRPNKSNVTKCFTIKTNSEEPNSNNYQKGVCAFVANFLKGNLLHGDIVVIFHEIGHIIHHIFGRAKYSIFSGTNVEHDFVEYYGMLTEKLAWEYDVLNFISPHNIPTKIVNKLVKLKNLDIGIRTRFKLLKAYFDLLVHSSPDFANVLENITKKNKNTELLESTLRNCFSKMYNEIMIVSKNGKKIGICNNNNIFIPAVWLHIVSGFESLYYSDILGDVYAVDTYTTFLDKSAINSNMLKIIKSDVIKYDPVIGSLERLKRVIGRDINLENYMLYYNFIPNNIQYSFFFSETIKSSSPKNIVYTVEESDDDVEYTNGFSEYNDSDVHSCVRID